MTTSLLSSQLIMHGLLYSTVNTSLLCSSQFVGAVRNGISQARSGTVSVQLNHALKVTVDSRKASSGSLIMDSKRGKYSSKMDGMMGLGLIMDGKMSKAA